VTRFGHGILRAAHKPLLELQISVFINKSSKLVVAGSNPAGVAKRFQELTRLPRVEEPLARTRAPGPTH